MGEEMRRKIFLLFPLPFLIRLIFSLTLKGPLFPDEDTYLRMIEYIRAGKGLSYPHLTASMPPFLPLLYTLITYPPFPDLLEIRLFQAIIGGLLGILIFLWGKELFSPRIAFISYTIYSLYPTLIFFSALILSESLYTFLLFLYLYSLWKMERENSLKWGILSGITGALSALTRASVFSLFPFLYILLLIIFLKEKKRLSILGIHLLTLTLLYSPWIIRNWVRFHHLIITTTDGGWVLYSGNNPLNRTGGGIEGVDVKFPEEARKLNEIERDRYFRRKALEYIRQHPRRFLWLAGKKFARLWRLYPSPTSGYAKKKFIFIMLLSYGLLLPFAFLGFFKELKRWRILYPLYLPLFIFTLTHMVFIGSIRYRIPLLPYFIYFASSGLGKIFSLRNEPG